MEKFKISHKIQNNINLYKISYWRGGLGKVISLRELSRILNINLEIIKNKIIENYGIIIENDIKKNGTKTQIIVGQVYFYKKRYAENFMEWINSCLTIKRLGGM